jgi:cadmium resistance protein CadD (predicted permease)
LAVPIGIGVKKLIELRKKTEGQAASSKHTVQMKNTSRLAFLSIAAVTFSNGGGLCLQNIILQAKLVPLPQY